MQFGSGVYASACGATRAPFPTSLLDAEYPRNNQSGPPKSPQENTKPISLPRLRKRERLPSSGCIESDPAVTLPLTPADHLAGPLPIQSYHISSSESRVEAYAQFSN